MAHWRSKELTIYITDECNMDCDYCYPGNYKEGRRVISSDFVISAINFFLRDQSGPCHLNKLRYYALGEPTLEMELIKTSHAHAVKVGPADISFELQTNGAFSSKAAAWIRNNIDVVWVSLDGPPEIHDAQRPFPNRSPSSPVVLRNIKKLLQGSCKVGIRPTITPLSITRMNEILQFSQHLGVDALYFHHAIKSQGKNSKTEGSLYQVPLMEFARRYLEDVVPFIPAAGLFVGNFLTINFDEESPYYCRSCLACPQLTVDGYISACDKAPLGTDQRFRSMIIGRWDENAQQIHLFPDKIHHLQRRRIENMDPCRNCEIRLNCGGGCLGESNFLFGDMYKPIDEYCQAVKFLAAHLPRNTGKLFPFTHP